MNGTSVSRKDRSAQFSSTVDFSESLLFPLLSAIRAYLERREILWAHWGISRDECTRDCLHGKESVFLENISPDRVGFFLHFHFFDWNVILILHHGKQISRHGFGSIVLVRNQP